MEVVPGGIEEQTEQVLKNLKAVVEASGSTLPQVVKTTVGRSYISMVFSTNSLQFAGLSQVDERFRQDEQGLCRRFRNPQARQVGSRGSTLTQRRPSRD